MNDTRVVLESLLVPVISPLDEQGDLDRASFEAHVSSVLSAGAHGLWINGTSGDFHAITDGETVDTVRIARGVAGPGVPIVGHVGRTATARALELAGQVMDAGADHVAAVTPYYTAYTDAELKRHHRALAERSGAGVVLYQHPSTGKAPLSVETIVELSLEGTCAGIKESGNDFEYFRSLMQAVRAADAPLRTFHGAGARALESLDLGTSGMITVIANLLPATCAALYSAYRAGDRATAERLQRRVTEFGEAIVRCLPERGTGTAVVAAYKCVLRELGVIRCAAVPEPFEPLTKREISRLLDVVLPLAAVDRAVDR